MYRYDSRVVMTLDAGGTNFVFSAICGNSEVVTPITYPSNADNLNDCLAVMVKGFTEVRALLKRKPVAISFAFPGPADYSSGVIGDLPNFPSFRGGVTLGGYLQESFKIPVFINNDGNLFAYGEALAGFMVRVNTDLEASGSSRRYKNLVGITLGTGFGAGVVVNNQLLLGDNGSGGDLWCFRNKLMPGYIAEESVSIRAVKAYYQTFSNTNNPNLTPYDIYNIAQGVKDGDMQAAIKSFVTLGEVAGDVIAQAVTLVDGLVVIGGGLAGASKYILPAILEEMRRNFSTLAGDTFSRMQVNVCDYNNPQSRADFLTEKCKQIDIPGFAGKTSSYRYSKEVAIAVSSLGTSKAIALGAYAFALAQLDAQ